MSLADLRYDPNCPKIDRRFGFTSIDEWIAHRHDVLVSSSNVFMIGYDLEKKQLFVSFSTHGKGRLYTTYRYDLVPERVAREMYQCSSLGGFVWYRLRKGGYPVLKVR
jgi:hypothetical protein